MDQRTKEPRHGGHCHQVCPNSSPFVPIRTSTSAVPVKLSFWVLSDLSGQALAHFSPRFTTPYRSWELCKGKSVNSSGNHKKSLQPSIMASLEKLQTDYCALLYVPWWVSFSHFLHPPLE